MVKALFSNKFFPLILLSLVALIIFAGLLLWFRPKSATFSPAPITTQPSTTPTQPLTSSPSTQSVSGFLPPLDQAQERVTKKFFGTYVTPQDSPVQPERFTGYHTGADFETFLSEQNSPVSVHAICQGKLLAAEYASGYGGVAVESCNLNGQPITVIYGHLKLASITTPINHNLAPGDVLGVLGAGYSSETDGERKHLHLGFHQGSNINLLGYVQAKAELSDWLDPCLYVCHD